MADIELQSYNDKQYIQTNAPSPHLRQLANPAPLGLFSFASTTFILSMINIQARGVAEPNIVVGMALGCGGLAQFCAGMWEFASNNTFGATAFTSYGAFWISYGIIFIPGSGILAAYTAETTPKGDLDNAVAYFLAAWFIFTTCMFMASLRSSIGLVALFFCLDITFMFLMIGAFTLKENITKVGGAFGLVTAAIAYYVAASGVINQNSSIFSLPVGSLKRD